MHNHLGSYPVPPLEGRQSVRDAVQEFATTWGMTSLIPIAVLEKLINTIIDIAVGEAEVNRIKRQ